MGRARQSALCVQSPGVHNQGVYNQGVYNRGCVHSPGAYTHREPTYVAPPGGAHSFHSVRRCWRRLARLTFLFGASLHRWPFHCVAGLRPDRSASRGCLSVSASGRLPHPHRERPSSSHTVEPDLSSGECAQPPGVNPCFGCLRCSDAIWRRRAPDGRHTSQSLL